MSSVRPTAGQQHILTGIEVRLLEADEWPRTHQVAPRLGEAKDLLKRAAVAVFRSRADLQMSKPQVDVFGGDAINPTIELLCETVQARLTVFQVAFAHAFEFLRRQQLCHNFRHRLRNDVCGFGLEGNPFLDGGQQRYAMRRQFFAFASRWSSASPMDRSVSSGRPVEI